MYSLFIHVRSTFLSLNGTSVRVQGLEIVCFMDPSAQTHVLGDPDRLRQILLNLFSNGIKFTDVGQVLLRAIPHRFSHSSIATDFSA